jgi:hypothetical protein
VQIDADGVVMGRGVDMETEALDVVDVRRWIRRAKLALFSTVEAENVRTEPHRAELGRILAGGLSPADVVAEARAYLATVPIWWKTRYPERTLLATVDFGLRPAGDYGRKLKPSV